MGVFRSQYMAEVGADFSALFGFGPKPGGFVVQKRNETPETLETPETPETLSMDVRIAFLSTYQRTCWQS